MQNLKFNFVDIKPPEKKDHASSFDIIPADNSILIIGRQGSGKTYLIDQMIKNPKLLGKKYDAIYFVGPSPIPLVNDSNRTEVHNILPDIDWMREKCDKWNKIAKNEKKRKCTILFTLDDVLAMMEKWARNEDAQMFFWNRRHQYDYLTVSFLFTAQYARAFPRRFRSCVNTVIAFSMSEEDWKIIAKDCMFKRTKEQEHLIPIHLSKPHNFICIRCDTGHVFLNFSELV